MGLPLLHRTADVAVGNQTFHTAVAERDTKAQLALAHMDDGLAQMHVGGNNRKVVAAHHILGGGEQAAAQLAAGVELGEVAGLEVAHLHQRHGQGVAHGQRGGGAARGGQVQRTCFALYVHRDVGGGIFGQQRGGVAGHRNDGDVHVQHHGDEPEQLVGVARVAQRYHHIIWGHHAKVAVIHVEGIDEKGGGAGAGQCGGYLGAYVPALAHTCHDNLSMAVIHQLGGFVEVVVKLVYQVGDGFRLFTQTLNGVLTDGVGT